MGFPLAFSHFFPFPFPNNRSIVAA